MQGEGFFLSPGGKGANQAVVCARMGADNWFMGKVGDDLFGQSLLDGLSDYGVHTDYLVREPNVTTGVQPIMPADYRGSMSHCC